MKATKIKTEVGLEQVRTYWKLSEPVELDDGTTTDEIVVSKLISICVRAAGSFNPLKGRPEANALVDDVERIDCEVLLSLFGAEVEEMEEPR